MFESTRDQATSYLKGKGYKLSNANINRMMDYLEATQEREAPAWIREHGALTAGFEKDGSDDGTTKAPRKLTEDGASESDKRQRYEFVRGKPKPDIPDRERRPETKADADRPSRSKPKRDTTDYKGEPPAKRPPFYESPNTSKAIPDDAPLPPIDQPQPTSTDDILNKLLFPLPMAAAGGAAAIPFLGPRGGGSPAMAALVPPTPVTPPRAGAAAIPEPVPAAPSTGGGGPGGGPVPALPGPGPTTPQSIAQMASGAPALEHKPEIPFSMGPTPTPEPAMAGGPAPVQGEVYRPGQTTPADVAQMVDVTPTGPATTPPGPSNLPATTAQPQSPMDLYREGVGESWSQDKAMVAQLPTMPTGNPAVPMVHVGPDDMMYDARTLEPVTDPLLRAQMEPRIRARMNLRQNTGNADIIRMLGALAGGRPR